VNNTASTNEPTTTGPGRAGWATARGIILHTALMAGAVTAAYLLMRNLSHQEGAVAEWSAATVIFAEKIGANANVLDLAGIMLVLVMTAVAIAKVAQVVVASRFGRKPALWAEARQDIQDAARRLLSSYLVAMIVVSLAAGVAGLPVAALTADGAASILVYGATLLAVVYSSVIAQAVESRTRQADKSGPKSAEACG
jgi:hypothetical protein